MTSLNQADRRPLVKVRGLHFNFGTRSVLENIDLEIHRGRITAILGPSGCGKTTLLNAMGGLWRPAAGTVLFDGVDINQIRRNDLYKLRRRVGMQFQAQALLTDLSVYENVAFPLREHTDLPESLIRDIVVMKLHTVGLRGARDLFPEQLSGGMARRVAFARATALDPDLVMYDEPFAGQDPITLGVLQRLIRTQNQALGTTSVVVTHSVDEALSIADDVYVIADRRIVAHGTPTSIRESKSAYVQDFLSSEKKSVASFDYPAPSVDADFLGAATTASG